MQTNRSPFPPASLRCLSLAAALAAAGAGGCGSSSAAPADGGALPDTAPAQDDAALAERAACGSPDPGMLDFLDNMEDGDSNILNRDGRAGGWYTYHDPTDGTITPAIGGGPFTMEMIPSPRCGSSHRAMRVSGSGYGQWGAGFGMALKAGMVNGEWTGLPYDATGARGISFWARAGESSTTTLLAMVADAWSEPVGGHCDPSIPNGDTACYDHFGVSVPLTTTWQRFSYSFGEMQQRQFGLPRPTLDVTQVTNIEFAIPQASSVFDIWVDDVAFFQ